MIREILVSDAEEFLALNKKIDDETNFMLFEKMNAIIIDH